MLAFLGSLCQDAELAALHIRQAVHSWNESNKSWIRMMSSDVLRIEVACACSVPIAPSKIKHSSASLGMFAARKFQKYGTLEGYYETLVSQACRLESTQKRFMRMKF